MPRFSIATALYNHKPFLAERVRSIFAQTAEDWEWVIVDDCSTDGSYEEICRLTEGDPRVRVLRNQTNQGPAISSQRAYEQASGEYLYRVDSDDSCHPRFLEAVGAELDRDHALAVAVCRALYMDPQHRVWGGRRGGSAYRLNRTEALTRLLERNFCVAPATLFRMSAVRHAGGVTVLPSVGQNVDWHLLLRVCMHGELRYIDRPLAYYRRHPDNISVSEQSEANYDRVEATMLGLVEDTYDRLAAAHLVDRVPDRTTALRSAADIIWRYIVQPRSDAHPEETQEWLDVIRRHVPDYAPRPPRRRWYLWLGRLARTTHTALTRQRVEKHAKRAV
jgi:glycosyltransferase involved in cell wall biosynthesis